MVTSRRRLPHWFPNEKAIFLTWRLHGSLAPNFRAQRTKENIEIPGLKKLWSADRYLGRDTSGPLWLKDPRIAECVVDSLRKGTSLGHYALHAYVVMTNHVHVLLTPRIAVPRATNSLKGSTARIANKILGRTGQPFWAAESFDHWIRTESEFFETLVYIEQNPVVAGLVRNAEEFKWSSAYRGLELDVE